MGWTLLRCSRVYDCQLALGYLMYVQYLLILRGLLWKRADAVDLVLDECLCCLDDCLDCDERVVFSLSMFPGRDRCSLCCMVGRGKIGGLSLLTSILCLGSCRECNYLVFFLAVRMPVSSRLLSYRKVESWARYMRKMSSLALVWVMTFPVHDRKRVFSCSHAVIQVCLWVVKGV